LNFTCLEWLMRAKLLFYCLLCCGVPIAASAGAALALVVLTGVPPAGAAASVRYVALGDSYSSGLGAGNYDSSSGACERSANAYPEQWASSHAPASFTSVACAGATTSDVLSSQVSALRARTTLVSITIGGNDAGFYRIMETCLLESGSACRSAISSAESFVAKQLPARLDATLRTIHAHAPRARIVVLDYPELYDPSRSMTCIGISAVKRTAIDQGANLLDRVISAAAARNGATFADVRSHFSGHELCDSSSWLHSVAWPIGESYHPTGSGQELGYLPAFSAAAG
jgi:lysophospholipase L1-like esterase